MKKIKSEKQDQFIYHILKPLMGYGLPRKRSQKTKGISGDDAKRKI